MKVVIYHRINLVDAGSKIRESTSTLTSQELTGSSIAILVYMFVKAFRVCGVCDIFVDPACIGLSSGPSLPWISLYVNLNSLHGYEIETLNRTVSGSRCL